MREARRLRYYFEEHGELEIIKRGFFKLFMEYIHKMITVTAFYWFTSTKIKLGPSMNTLFSERLQVLEPQFKCILAIAEPNMKTEATK